MDTKVVGHHPDLTLCPKELQELDPNAEKLWLEFLRRTGVSMSVDRKTVIDNGSKRAWVIRNIGIPSLIQRLSAANSELQRAKCWWRESMACGAGESVSDLSSQNMAVLNPFIVTKSLKFKDTRFEKIAERRKEQELMESVQMANGARLCGNSASRHFLSPDVRADARFCDKSCKQEAYRLRRATATP